MRGIRRFAAPFVVALTALSFAQIAAMQPAGATNACGINCFVNGTTGNDATGNGTSVLPWKTIQFGVDNVGSNGTVNVATGTYTENVVVTQPVTVSGAGQGNTIVVPATSAPNPCVGSSLCGGAASVVFLIRSASVNIAGLTVDGDNPANASGVVVNGADIDARDGIETDFNAGVFNQLTVFNVTVKNIFLRGIEFTDGSGYLITGNNINNVAGDSSNSIAIDGDSAAGTISGNNVSNTPGAIATNHSKGTSMTGNAITTSDSGIHSDNNGDSGGVADSITNNNVTCTTGGFGVFTFVPYLNQTVSGNSVSGCGVGVSDFGSCNFTSFNDCPGGVVPTVTFTSNGATATSAAGASFAVATDTGFGDAQAKVTADHNTFTGSGEGVEVDESGTATANVTLRRNNLAPNSVSGVNNTGGTTVAANCNWWGNASGPNPPGTGTGVSGPVTHGINLKTSNLNGNCTFPPSINALVGPGDGSGDVTFTPGNPDGSPFSSFSVSCTSSNGGHSGFASGPGSPMHVSGLDNGKTYTCTATATSANGTSDPSNASQPFVPQAGGGGGGGGATPPGAPTHVKASKIKPGQLKVTFNGPSKNGGAKVTKYDAVCTSSNGGARKVGSKANPPGRPIAVTGLTAGKKYTCIVKATNSAGVGPASAPSNTVTA